jgi:hypothetical protein
MASTSAVSAIFAADGTQDTPKRVVIFMDVKTACRGAELFNTLS